MLIDKDLALMTVTDSGFLLGTKVLLYSFYKYNPWFSGDCIIIETDLTDQEKAELGIFPNVVFQRPSAALVSRIQILAEYWPIAIKGEKQFYSLEAFRFMEYEKVLYLDSDILCVGDLSPIFSMKVEYPLFAVPDVLAKRGQIREKDTFIPRSNNDITSSKVYYKSFNSGVFMVHVNSLNPSCYLELVKAISPILFSFNETRHTDQYVLNQYFQNNVGFLPDKYNFLVHLEPEKRQSDDMMIDDIRILHYCLLYTSPSPRDLSTSRMPSSA